MKLPYQCAIKFVQEIADYYDTLKNCLGSMPYGDKLMINLIKLKHSNQHGMSFYYDTANESLIPDIDQV